VDKIVYHESIAAKAPRFAPDRCRHGDIVLVQDADLEYDPGISKADQAHSRWPADVVFGSRFMGSDAHRVVYFWHMIETSS